MSKINCEDDPCNECTEYSHCTDQYAWTERDTQRDRLKALNAELLDVCRLIAAKHFTDTVGRTAVVAAEAIIAKVKEKI